MTDMQELLAYTLFEGLAPEERALLSTEDAMYNIIATLCQSLNLPVMAEFRMAAGKHDRFSIYTRIWRMPNPAPYPARNRAIPIVALLTFRLFNSRTNCWMQSSM